MILTAQITILTSWELKSQWLKDFEITGAEKSRLKIQLDWDGKKKQGKKQRNFSYVTLL
jgi:hypothetical protein